MQGFSAASAVNATPLLSDSWMRSQLYGLDPTADDFPRLRQGELADVIASNASWQPFARLAIDQLAQQMAEKQAVVILSDASGLVLNTCGDMQALARAQRFALAPGNLWSECGRGTNAIGTALAINDGCEIAGQQHFLTRNQGLYCAAMPLQMPNGRLAGVIDISGPAHYSHAHSLQQVRDAARQIEYLWVKQSLHPQQWLMSLHADPRGIDSGDEMLLIFSDDVLTAANRLALETLAVRPEQLSSLTFAALFPALRQQNSCLTAPLMYNGQRYYFRLRAPQRRLVSVAASAAPHATSAPHDREKLVRLLNAGVSLCLQGETGSGKEFVSRALHQQSRWRSGNFVAINCAAIPESLIESELFGYQPGAFTGASKQGYAGKIREADGGILFLDEIGDMPLALQSRLLRVLQEKEVAPLGSSRSYPVNFAVICATHRDLKQQVAAGSFREDLLYRLQEFSLTLPPLRAWPNLPGFICQLWRELGAAERNIALSNDVVMILAQHAWPGNVRQLRSLLRVLLALAEDGEPVTQAQLPADYQHPADLPGGERQRHDEQLLNETLQRFDGNITKAAAALGVARSTLYRRAARVRVR